MSHATTDSSNASQPDDPDTKYSTGDELTNPFGRPYRVKSTYYSKHGTPMVHVRRRHGTHDMYLPARRITAMTETGDWTYEPQ